MIKKIICFIFLSSFFSVHIQGQSCASDSLYHARMNSDSIFRKEQEEKQKRWEIFQKKALEKKRKRRDLISDYRSTYPIDYDQNFIIPVVFHIIYDEEITTEKKEYNNNRIKDLLKYVNEVYAGIDPKTKNYKNGGVYIPIQFALAKSTPDNRPTDGIYHIDGRDLNQYIDYGLNHGKNDKGVKEEQIEAKSHFPIDFAVNIYIINKMSKNVLSNGKLVTAAYAYLGGHGTVWCIDMYAKRGDITLPHELGHTLGLYHLFNCEGGEDVCQSNQCPPFTGDCKKDDDKICDTEPTISFQQRTKENIINPCTKKPYEGGDFNIMHYGNALDRFTPGQVYRMIFELNDNPIKQALLNSPALNLPSKPIEIKPAKCIPTNIKEKDNPYNIGVTHVRFGDYIFNSEGYSREGKQVYIDKTLKFSNKNIQFIKGETYEFEVGAKINDHEYFAYIDYNNDGVFDESEKIFENKSVSKSSTFKTNITIAENAVENTPLRLRVVADFSEINLNNNSCANHTYGQTEDFAITIIPNPYKQLENKYSRSGKIGINTDYPETALDIVSKENGILFPRMNNQQMWDIKNPPLGAIVYNLNEHCFALNYGKEFPRWRCLATQVIDSFANSSQENNIIANPENIANEGKVGINTEEPQGVLEVKNNIFGVQFPRLNNTEIKKIKSPEEGLMLYNSSEKCLSINIGTSTDPIWRCIINKKIKI
ncbi:GEVED domain-containing protein [Ornithobacterium rhinotracheale]|uniref:GEVED domain-containing protein n=1 Tax=Ornithobacterium rhinotracheale TaxID=28251 RepID=UPI0040368FC9